jgi:RNA-binding protein
MKHKIKELGTQVHKLKPVVLIGNKGLTETVLAEIDASLEHHELIKIRIAGGDREYREQIIQDVCSKQNAILIKQIGHVFAIYRKKRE